MTPSGQADTEPPWHLVVMGVSGSGKSTVARALEERLGWAFAEGDDFHPPANLAKMASGRPLVDEDRLPWLEDLTRWAAEHDARGEPTVMTCSALRYAYRDILRRGGPGTFFVHLVGDKHMLLGRMGTREHFMPPELLESQLDTLEPLRPDEAGMVLDVAEPLTSLTEQVLDRLDLG